MTITITQSLANNLNTLMGTELFHEAHVGGTISTFGPRNSEELATLEITDRFGAITTALSPLESRGTRFVRDFGAANRPEPMTPPVSGTFSVTLTARSLLDYELIVGDKPKNTGAPYFESIMGPKYFADLDRAVISEFTYREREVVNYPLPDSVNDAPTPYRAYLGLRIKEMFEGAVHKDSAIRAIQNAGYALTAQGQWSADDFAPWLSIGRNLTGLGIRQMFMSCISLEDLARHRRFSEGQDLAAFVAIASGLGELLGIQTAQRLALPW